MVLFKHWYPPLLVVVPPKTKPNRFCIEYNVKVIWHQRNFCYHKMITGKIVCSAGEYRSIYCFWYKLWGKVDLHLNKNNNANKMFFSFFGEEIFLLFYFTCFFSEKMECIAINAPGIPQQSFSRTNFSSTAFSLFL